MVVAVAGHHIEPTGWKDGWLYFMPSNFLYRVVQKKDCSKDCPISFSTTILFNVVQHDLTPEMKYSKCCLRYHDTCIGVLEHNSDMILFLVRKMLQSSPLTVTPSLGAREKCHSNHIIFGI